MTLPMHFTGISSSHYIYFDYMKDREIVFECDAVNILEADELLLKATGIVASKANNIGCR